MAEKRESELRSVSREQAARPETGRDLAPYTSEFGSIMSTLGSMERLLEDTFRRPIFSPFKDIFREFGTVGEGLFYPTVDLYEYENEVIVKCDLPGMKKDDISLKFVDESTLVISGERKSVEKIERNDYLRHESSYGAFKRTLSLPEGCDCDKASASYKDGVLEIHVPRSETIRKGLTIPIS